MLGTAMIMTAVNWGGCASATPKCVGLTVFIMAQVFGPISGGHFNPAITLAMMIKHRHEECGKSIFFGLFIILFQFAGACLGCALTITGVTITPQSDSKLPEAG